MFRQAPPLPPAPPKNAAESVQKVTSKTDPPKVSILTQNDLPLDTQWEPKMTKMRSRDEQKIQLGKSTEKASEKAPILTAWTCRNHGRVMKNQGLQVLSKSIKNDLQRPPFWKPSGLPNRKKPSPGGCLETIEKMSALKSAPGSKKGPKREGFLFFFFIFLVYFSKPAPGRASGTPPGWLWRVRGDFPP